ncbi:hypothetical protein NIASO_20995 [Niabella soli DSM 19437]|uniref:Uncharacterized protein n=1 Tax=Niabella soli DSM 19437 TaxID=929713 RepID=W0F9P4_9BACT|nr:hypothetical protein NIASO_20995 [Niabella soli DSM 19437]
MHNNEFKQLLQLYIRHPASSIQYPYSKSSSK